MRPCKKCGSLNKYKNGVCRDCHLQAMEKYRSTDKAKIKQCEYREKNKEDIITKKRNKHLLQKYGISAEEYNALFEKQQGCCAICGKHQTESKWKFSVDHDHTTGQIRGILCINCNTAIGSLKENPELFKIALEYLHKWD